MSDHYLDVLRLSNYKNNLTKIKFCDTIFLENKRKETKVSWNLLNL